MPPLAGSQPGPFFGQAPGAGAPYGAYGGPYGGALPPGMPPAGAWPAHGYPPPGMGPPGVPPGPYSYPPPGMGPPGLPPFGHPYGQPAPQHAAAPPTGPTPAAAGPGSGNAPLAPWEQKLLDAANSAAAAAKGGTPPQRSAWNVPQPVLGPNGQPLTPAEVRHGGLRAGAAGDRAKQENSLRFVHVGAPRRWSCSTSRNRSAAPRSAGGGTTF